jgi:hypothetical protein
MVKIVNRLLGASSRRGRFRGHGGQDERSSVCQGTVRGAGRSRRVPHCRGRSLNLEFRSRLLPIAATPIGSRLPTARPAPFGKQSAVQDRLQQGWVGEGCSRDYAGRNDGRQSLSDFRSAGRDKQDHRSSMLIAEGFRSTGFVMRVSRRERPAISFRAQT